MVTIQSAGDQGEGVGKVWETMKYGISDVLGSPNIVVKDDIPLLKEISDRFPDIFV